MVLRGQGAFIYDDGRAVAHDAAAGVGDATVEIVLRRKNGRATVWIDGTLACEGDVGKEPAALGAGCVGGKARFTKIALRRL
jgi:hypothetical protein